MIVVCPFCNKEQEYKARTNQIRKRKYCSCGKRFEVKSNRTLVQIQKAKERTQKQLIKKFDWKPLDNKIADILAHQTYHGEITQKELSRTLNRSPSTISRHLKIIENLNLVKAISSGGVKTYELITKPENVKAITAHKIQVKCDILSGSINPKTFKEIQMKNWIKKQFKINYVTFELNSDKSVVFWITGAGKDVDEALNNAKEKGIEIKNYLEQKYSSRLSFPEFKFETGNQNPHYVPIKTTENDLEELQKVWCDKSHDGSIETDGKEFANDVVKAIPDIQQLKQDVSELKNNGNGQNGVSSEVKEELDKFRSQMTQFQNNISAQMSEFTNQISLLTNTISQLNNNLSSNRSGSPPDIYQ